MLKVSDASYQFSEDQQVLDKMSLSVSAGEIVALLGPSGCGKSTLLKLIAGLLPRQEGGYTQADGSSFSFVFQDASLMPWANVAQNIALPLRIRGEQRQDKIEEVLKLLEIEELANRYPSELSGGQKMRVSIARALAASPDILLLDEPFAALDELLRFKMNDLILSLRDNLNIATLFVTHSVYEAAYMADRVLIMQGGKVAGSVVPGLDRETPIEDQRSSAAFIIATKQISTTLAGGEK